MATSGTYIFNPDLAEIVDEAFERCRIDPALIVQRHVESARRSMRFMLADWATKEHHEFRVRQYTITPVISQAAYTAPTAFPTAMLDVLNVVLRRNGADTPMTLISRSDYLSIPNKADIGRPSQYWIDKQRGAITLYVWPVPENITDDIILDAVIKFEDSDTASDNADIPFYLYEAFAAGLAARLAEKYAPPELEEKLWIKGERALDSGNRAAREYGDIRFTIGSLGGARGRR